MGIGSANFKEPILLMLKDLIGLQKYKSYSDVAFMFVNKRSLEAGFRPLANKIARGYGAA